MKTYARALALFFTLLHACPSGHAAEQDNWYLANEWSVSNPKGVAYEVNATTGKARIYVTSEQNDNLKVFETNGTSILEVSGLDNPRYVKVDENGTIYITEAKRVTALDQSGNIKWRAGKTANSGTGQSGSGNGEFDRPYGIAISSNGQIFVADRNNHRVQVLDQDGSYIRQFGTEGTAPGQLKSPNDLSIIQGDLILVGDDNHVHFFNNDGSFAKRIDGNRKVAVASPDDLFLSENRNSPWQLRLFSSDGQELTGLNFIRDYYHMGGASNSSYAFTEEGDIIVSGNNKIQFWNRAYRTKGLPVRNVIPQPAVRAITQRAGTNIIDLDFEIIDPDDANATVGILAAQDGAFTDTSKWILPQTWVDGTASKIGTPIATNQVHRVSWNVKPDWPDSTGTLKFEIICHDARRTSPVELHFLTLPLPDGNLTISRSPLKDSDFESFAKFLLTTGQAELNATSNEVQFPPATVPSGDFVFTSAGKTGKDGPTSAEVNASYVGTPLEGNVTMTTQGIQEWTVPETGVYSIEVAGASGASGNNGSSRSGYGAHMIGKFNLNSGDTLNVVVGQVGISGGYKGGGGGGGSFVWIKNSTSPLIIGGGGGGGARSTNLNASDASIGINGKKSHDGNNGGSQGAHGQYNGGTGWISSDNSSSQAGKKFLGGDGIYDGGFGGGGAGADGGGAGGGYSGGGGGNNDPNTGGGAGSFNSGAEKIALVNESKNGFVRIRKIQANTPLVPTTLSTLLYDDRWSSGSLRFKLEQALGSGYRIATPEEVQKAREAATAGGVNQWTANRPVQPRNLPNKVNEYGFDTGDHGNRAWWIVQE